MNNPQLDESIDGLFNSAISTLQSLSTLPRPPLETRTLLYGLYQQATEGDAPETPPLGVSSEDVSARKKWDAWDRFRGLAQNEAKMQYTRVLVNYAGVHPSAHSLLQKLESLERKYAGRDSDKRLSLLSGFEFPSMDVSHSLDGFELIHNPKTRRPVLSISHSAQLDAALTEVRSALAEIRQLRQQDDTTSIYRTHRSLAGHMPSLGYISVQRAVQSSFLARIKRVWDQIPPVMKLLLKEGTRGLFWNAVLMTVLWGILKRKGWTLVKQTLVGRK